MTSEELQAIRARVTTASDGPWSVRRIPNSYDSPVGDRYTHPCVRGFRVPRRLYNLAHQQVEVDAEFMANARQDVPALLAEVERLRATITECGRAMGELLQARQASLDDLARIDQFIADEQGQWESPQKRQGEVRRLFMTSPRMRPREKEQGAELGTGRVAAFPVAAKR